jgi:hypothetical protein
MEAATVRKRSCEKFKIIAGPVAWGDTKPLVGSSQRSVGLLMRPLAEGKSGFLAILIFSQLLTLTDGRGSAAEPRAHASGLPQTLMTPVFSCLTKTGRRLTAVASNLAMIRQRRINHPKSDILHLL